MRETRILARRDSRILACYGDLLANLERIFRGEYIEHLGRGYFREYQNCSTNL
jgi:hypothetical protein